MDKKELIQTGEYLISKIFQKDVFGIGSMDDVLEEKDLILASEWARNIELYLINNPSISEAIEDNGWIINGERASKQRMQNIVDILKVYKG